MKRVLIAAAAAMGLALGGCALVAGDVGMPVGNAPSKVTTQRLTETTFTVSVVGELDTSQTVINDTLMRNAAERTLFFGYDHFTTRWAPTPQGGDFLNTYMPRGTFMVEMSKGPPPAGAVGVHDAREVSQRLGTGRPAS